MQFWVRQKTFHHENCCYDNTLHTQPEIANNTKQPQNVSRTKVSMHENGTYKPTRIAICGRKRKITPPGVRQ